MKSSATVLSLYVLSFAGLATAHDGESLLLGRQANNGCPTCDPAANQCGAQASCDIRGTLLENACVCSYGRRASLDMSWRLYVEAADEYIVIVPQGVACDQQCTVLQFDNVCGEVPDVPTTCTTSKTSTSPSPESTTITTDDNSTTGDLTSTPNGFTTEDTSTSEDPGSQTSSSAVFTEQTSSDTTTASTTTTTEDPMSSTTMMDDETTTDDITSSAEDQGSRTSSTVVFTETTSSGDAMTTTRDLATSTTSTPTADNGSTTEEPASTTGGSTTEDSSNASNRAWSHKSLADTSTENASSVSEMLTAPTNTMTMEDLASTSDLTGDASARGHSATHEVSTSAENPTTMSGEQVSSHNPMTSGDSQRTDVPAMIESTDVPSWMTMATLLTNTVISMTDPGLDTSFSMSASMATSTTAISVSTSFSPTVYPVTTAPGGLSASGWTASTGFYESYEASSQSLFSSLVFVDPDALSMATEGSRSDVFESTATLDISTSTVFSGSPTSTCTPRTLPKISASEISNFSLYSDGKIPTPYTPVFTLLSGGNPVHVSGTDPAPPEKDSAYATCSSRGATEASEEASGDAQPVDHSRSVFVGSTSVAPLAFSTPLPEEATNTVALVCCTCALGASPLTLTRNADARWTTSESVTDQLIAEASGHTVLGKGGKEHSSTAGFDDSTVRELSWTSPHPHSLAITSGGNRVFSLGISHLVLVVFGLRIILL